MNKSDYDIQKRSLETMKGAVNYHKWIYSNFADIIGDRVIELGAGTGNFTELLLDKELVVAVDNDEAAIVNIRERFSDFENLVAHNIDISNPELLELRRYNAKTVVCINVLEHIEDDASALLYMYKLLPEEGKLALLVPAFQSLFGSFDLLVGHYRRYVKKDLHTKLTDSGFRVKDMYYMNCISPAGWFFNYRVLKRKAIPSSQVKFFDRYIVPWLMRTERIIRPPFGLSLVAKCEK